MRINLTQKLALRLLRRGHSLREVAAALGVSARALHGLLEEVPRETMKQERGGEMENVFLYLDTYGRLQVIEKTGARENKKTLRGLDKCPRACYIEHKETK